MPIQPYVRGRSSALREGRVSEDFACYFVTKVVDRRRPLLATDQATEVVFNSWQFLRSRHRMKLFAFCVMPNHYHLVICLMPGEGLSKLMEDTNKFTARKLNQLLRIEGTFWQNGFQDHRCRNERELHELCLYVEHNPVRKGLVTAADLWPYSSAYPANMYMLDRVWWP